MDTEEENIVEYNNLEEIPQPVRRSTWNEKQIYILEHTMIMKKYH